jgi:type II secretory pathway predicted ATPase ExeA
MITMRPPLTNVIGYQEEAHELIRAFFTRKNTDLKDRIMAVCGFAGSGKSALCRHTVNYLINRNWFSGGCIYINARGIHEFGNLLQKLIRDMENNPCGIFDR